MSTKYGDRSMQDMIRTRLDKFIEGSNTKQILAIYTLAATIYIYLPIISLTVFSFNEGGLTFPFIGFTLDWYLELLSNESMMRASFRSIQLALVVTVITTILGTMMALAYQYDFWGKMGLLYLLFIGIITPGITYGIGATLLFNQLLGISKGLWLAVPVHVVWTLPFASIILLAGLPSNLAENQQAAQIMGATRYETFRYVTLPQIAPTVLGAAVFAFTLSYNEASRGLLLVGQATTIPIEIFAIVSTRRATPELFALGSLTTIISILLLAVAGLITFSQIE